MQEPSGRTAQIQTFLERLLEGDESARKELHDYTWRRFRRLTKWFLVGDRVYEKGSTDAVWHIVWIKIQEDLDELPRWAKTENVPTWPYALAHRFISRVGTIIRRSIVEIARSPAVRRMRTNIDVEVARNPADLFLRHDVHEKVDLLPEDEQAIIDKHIYSGASLVDIAKLQGTCTETVERKWRNAIKTLRKSLKAYGPES